MTSAQREVTLDQCLLCTGYKICFSFYQVVVPDLDVIDPDSLSYTAAPGNVHGSFTWNLTFVWKSLFQQIPSELTHLPIKLVHGNSIAINPCPAELFQLHFSLFEAGIANAISSFK